MQFEVGPGKVIISESNAEAYLGSLHAYLAIYGWRECGAVPAFQAVYGGWSVNVGATGWPADTAGVHVFLAQQFTYGHVLQIAIQMPSCFHCSSENAGKIWNCY